MKTKIFTGTLLAAALIVVGIRATPNQSSAGQTQQDPTTQSQPGPGMMGRGQGMMGQGQGQGMMGGGMMGTMGRMTTRHQQMTTLMNKLMESMKAIQAEKDPAALKTKLAEHQALLEQMRDHMTQQGKMMQGMTGQVKQYCPAASGAVPANPGN